MDASRSILPIFKESQLWRIHGKLCFLLQNALCYTTTFPLGVSLVVITGNDNYVADHFENGRTVSSLYEILDLRGSAS